MIPHILIVDADQGAARTTRALVARLAPDATLLVEPHPDRGRISLQQRRADVLIIDPSPHHLAAADLIKWLKIEDPAASVIVLTSTPALRQKMEELGVDLYQDKHQSPSALARQLRGVLEKVARSAEIGGLSDNTRT